MKSELAVVSRVIQKSTRKSYSAQQLGRSKLLEQLRKISLGGGVGLVCPVSNQVLYMVGVHEIYTSSQWLLGHLGWVSKCSNVKAVLYHLHGGCINTGGHVTPTRHRGFRYGYRCRRGNRRRELSVGKVYELYELLRMGVSTRGLGWRRSNRSRCWW